MRQYIVRRLLMFIPVLVLVSIIIFLVLRILPGDVALIILGEGGGFGDVSDKTIQALRRELGIDRPLHIQYLEWLWGMLRLDAGNSFYSGRPVFAEIARRLPVTLEMTLLTVIVAWLVSVPMGVISAVRQDSWIDYLVRVLSIGGLALPTFWSGTLLILFLVIYFKWMPPVVWANLFDNPWENLQQMVWPVLVLSYYNMAYIARMTRSCMLEVIRHDYIRTAWSKGLRERAVIYRHALKNALLPIVTIAGVQIAFLLGGCVVMETVFVLPGMGSNLIDSIHRRDYPMTQTIIVLFGMSVATVNLAVDILYAWLDPRVAAKG